MFKHCLDELGLENAKIVSKFQVATACFSCRLPDLNSTLSLYAVKVTGSWDKKPPAPV
jgi:hypothetical protein